jgi:nicotinate-nucleotide adenylyltransferase
MLGELLRSRGAERSPDLHEAAAGRIFVHPVTQLEISSTDLRNIILSGRDPRYLVPDAVRDIIRTTGCYTHTTTR